MGETPASNLADAAESPASMNAEQLLGLQVGLLAHLIV